MSLEAAQERHKTIGRNDACTCGSGKKYKKCHQVEDDQLINAELRRLVDLKKADAAALAEAEAAEGKASGGKSAPSGKPTGQAHPPGERRGGGKVARGGASKSKGDKAQSLPRRGAV